MTNKSLETFEELSVCISVCGTLGSHNFSFGIIPGAENDKILAAAMHSVALDASVVLLIMRKILCRGWMRIEERMLKMSYF